MIEAQRMRDQQGMVGKSAVIWLLIAALIVVAGIDVVSIGRSTFRLSEVAADAARNGATVYQSEGRSETRACAAVSESVEALEPALKLGRKGCRVDAESGGVTVTLKDTADTILVDRFGPTSEYAVVVVSETASPSSV